MNEQQISELIDKLEGVSQTTFEVTVQQQVHEGMFGVGLAGFFLLIVLSLAYKTHVTEYKKADTAFLFFTMEAAVGVGCLLWICEATLHLLNPEYYAIIDLIG